MIKNLKTICSIVLQIVVAYAFMAFLQQIWFAYKNVGYNPIVAQDKIYDKTLMNISNSSGLVLSCVEYELESTGRISRSGFENMRFDFVQGNSCPDEIARKQTTMKQQEEQVAKIVDYYKKTFRYKITNFFLKKDGRDILTENEITREFALKKLEEVQLSRKGELQ